MKKSRVDMTVSDQQLEKELKRSVIKSKSVKRFCRFISFLIVIFAVFVLVSVMLLPVHRITENSMEPTLKQGEIVVALRTRNINQDNVIAIYFENQILVKRVVGMPGDYILLDKQGIVTVNEESIDEEYLSESVTGTTDLVYPYLVPEKHYFVIADNREESTDSGIFQFGCIPEEKIIGKILFCVWPLNRIGYIE